MAGSIYYPFGMQIKASLAKGLLLALTISLMPAPATSAQKVTPGSKCKVQKQKVAYQNKTYTCIKLGKKLVWNEGVGILKKTPTPTKQKAVFAPWATEFDTQLMIQAALDATDEYFGEVKPSNSYEMNIDPVITADDRAWITRVLDYVNGAFSNFEREKVRVFLGSNHDWSANTLRAENLWVGDRNSPFPCGPGLLDAYCAERNIVLLIYSDMYSGKTKTRWDVGRRSTPAHEMFHTVQFALAGPNVGGLDPTYIPRWLMEGRANYFGYYINEKLGFDIYLSGRNQEVTNNTAYRSIYPLTHYNNFENNPYGIGQAATEYLVASAGFEKFLNIWKFTKSEQNFDKGFKKAIGIDISDFYSKFDVARSSMKIGPP
jgi:hypothetical protein